MSKNKFLQTFKTFLINERHCRYPTNGEVSIVAGDFVMETWFYVLIGAIVLFKIIVIGGIIYIRRHNIFAKKTAIPNIYGTN